MSYLKDFIPENSVLYKGKSEASAEAEVILPDYYPPVMRIIRTEAVPFIRSKTVYGDKIAAEGNVEFRILYQSESGETNSFFYKAPFSHTVEIQGLGDILPDLSAFLGYKDIRALSPQKLSLRASVVLSVFAVKSENREILAEEKGIKDGVALLSSEESFCRKTAAVSKIIRHSGEISLEGKPSMEKIIRYDIRFANAEFKPMNKKALVKSDMIIDILYISPDSKKPAFIQEKTVISQLMDAETDENSAGVIFASSADCRFDLKENAEGKIVSVGYDTETEIGFSVYSERRFCVISDAFGTEKEIETVREKICSEKIAPQKQSVLFEEQADIGPFSEIYDVSVFPALSDTRFDPESHVCEANGVFLVSALFSDADGEITSCEKKIPFTLKNDAPENCTGVRQEICVSLQNLSYEAADGKISCKIECLVSGAVFLSEEKEVITKIAKLDEEREEDDSHLVLYYAKKGEKLWDIAKKYRADPDAVSEANNLNEQVLGEEKMLFITKFV